MANKYKIRTYILCDIARKEAGGKDVLIGVYSDSLMASDVPCTMPSLAVWVQIKPTKLKYESAAVEIIAPNGKPIVKGKGKIEFSSTKEYVGIPFQFPTLTLPSEGIYKITLSLDDDAKEIGEFTLNKGPAIL